MFSNNNIGCRLLIPTRWKLQVKAVQIMNMARTHQKVNEHFNVYVETLKLAVKGRVSVKIRYDCNKEVSHRGNPVEIR